MGFGINFSTPITGTNAAGPSTLSVGAGNFLIGARYQNATIFQYYQGLIGELMIFERALKIEEVRVVNSYLSKKFSIKVQ